MYYRGATSLEGSSAATKSNDSTVHHSRTKSSDTSALPEMDKWLKQNDERDEEMLLRYVSNITLISPLDLSQAADVNDSFL